jgi:hypothetical protein
MRKRREEKEDPEGSRMIKYGNSKKFKREGAPQTCTCVVLVFYGMPTCSPCFYPHFIPRYSYLFFSFEIH